MAARGTNELRRSRPEVDCMRRRDFIKVIAGLGAGLPHSAGAQQSRKPVIGFLYAGSPGLAPMAPFHQALAESGYVEGQSVTIEYRYAAGQYDKLPELAADLVHRQVSVIVATPNPVAPLAAKAASATIPIVFAVAIDPTKLGLVDSLNRPGGNATGVNYFISELVAKRMGVLRELVPKAARLGVLINPNEPSSESFRKEVITAASTIGIHADFVQASNAQEIEAAFTTFVRNRDDALIVLPDTLFANQRAQIVALAARHAIPGIYAVREYVEAGGLISYGTRLAEVYRQLGLHTARILKGANPAELPVVQMTRFDLVINLRAARALGIEIPPMLLAQADDVIE
jgi:putative tryptophan/tyrosine transport system substrate-binding protein